MRLADSLQKALDDMMWSETLERDEAEQTAMLHVVYQVHEQHFDLYLQTDEEKDWIQVYLYTPFHALAAKHHDCALLCNRINCSFASGSIQMLSDGRIRFRHTVDVEGTEPSTAMIRNLIYAGGELFDLWFEELSAVALTKTTAQEIFARLDAKQSQGASAGDEVPVPAPDAGYAPEPAAGEREKPQRLH